MYTQGMADVLLRETPYNQILNFLTKAKTSNNKLCQHPEVKTLWLSVASLQSELNDRFPIKKVG